MSYSSLKFFFLVLLKYAVDIICGGLLLVPNTVWVFYRIERKLEINNLRCLVVLTLLFRGYREIYLVRLFLQVNVLF
jgi:hypothetical protein